MSKIKSGGLNQYGAERFGQQLFGTPGVEGVNTSSLGRMRRLRSQHGVHCLIILRQWHHAARYSSWAENQLRTNEVVWLLMSRRHAPCLASTAASRRSYWKDCCLDHWSSGLQSAATSEDKLLECWFNSWCCAESIYPGFHCASALTYGAALPKSAVMMRQFCQAVCHTSI